MVVCDALTFQSAIASAAGLSMPNVSGAARLLHDVVEESDIAAATFVRPLPRWSNFARHHPLDELVLPEDHNSMAASVWNTIDRLRGMLCSKGAAVKANRNDDGCEVVVGHTSDSDIGVAFSRGPAPISSATASVDKAAACGLLSLEAATNPGEDLAAVSAGCLVKLEDLGKKQEALEVASSKLSAIKEVLEGPTLT